MPFVVSLNVLSNPYCCIIICLIIRPLYGMNGASPLILITEASLAESVLLNVIDFKARLKMLLLFWGVVSTSFTWANKGLCKKSMQTIVKQEAIFVKAGNFNGSAIFTL